MLGHDVGLYGEKWPLFDANKVLSDRAIIAIQVNGKLRDTMDVPRGMSNDDVSKEALARPAILKWTEGKEPRKVIVVPEKIVNIVL
jgi:leucyl-tRNA synthetase